MRTVIAMLFLVIPSYAVADEQLASMPESGAYGHCDGPRPECTGGTIQCLCDRSDNCEYVCFK